MRKDNSFFENEIETTNKIINNTTSPPSLKKEQDPQQKKSLTEWSKILNKKITVRKKGEVIIQEGFQMSFLLTREGDFEVLEEIQKYAEENCGGNVTLAVMQLCKKGLKK